MELSEVDPLILAEEVIKLADEYPSAQYEPPADEEFENHEYAEMALGKCFYTMGKTEVNNGVGCIIGQALGSIGITQDTLFKNEFGCASDLLREQFNDGNDKEYNLIRALDDVQQLQDEGNSWGTAVENSGLREYLDRSKSN